jgi:hypothetical protein
MRMKDAGPFGTAPFIGRLLRGEGGGLFGFLLGAEGVAAVGAGGHGFPGGSGPEAAVADVVERGGVSVGAGFEGSGAVEIVLTGHWLSFYRFKTRAGREPERLPPCPVRLRPTEC